MKNSKGQSMFEVVLAIAIIGLVVVGVVILSTNAIRNTTFSKNQTLSSRYTQEALEWLRNERNTNPTNFRNRILTPIYCLDSLAWGNSGPCGSGETIPSTSFKRQAGFTTTTGQNTKGEDVIIISATVTVTWTDSQGLHEVKSSTELSDLREL